MPIRSSNVSYQAVIFSELGPALLLPASLACGLTVDARAEWRLAGSDATPADASLLVRPSFVSLGRVLPKSAPSGALEKASQVVG